MLPGVYEAFSAKEMARGQVAVNPAKRLSQLSVHPSLSLAVYRPSMDGRRYRGLWGFSVLTFRWGNG